MDSKSTIRIPDSLGKQIGQYRRAAQRLKLGEIIGVAFTAMFAGFLVIFSVERWVDTSNWFRCSILVCMLVAFSLVPLAWYRWVFRLTSNTDVAQLLRRYQPRLGASLQGVIELADNAHEHSRSRTLCEAALRQVAESFRNKDLLAHLPPSRRPLWSKLAFGTGLVTLLLFVLLPAAAQNSWLRIVFPFSSVERFTFAKLAPLPERLVVPFGEDFQFPLRLASETLSRPNKGTLHLAGSVHTEPLSDEGIYPFAIAGLRNSAPARITVGDSHSTVLVEPSMRPELQKLTASIELPTYLEITEPRTRDLRSGSLSVLRGSRVHFFSETSKPIASATANGTALPVTDGVFQIRDVIADSEQNIALNWQDVDGLSAKNDFPLSLQIHEDEAPIVFGEGLPKTQVLLDTEQIQFLVRAADDFGVKHVGLEWKTLDWKTGESQDSSKEFLTGITMLQQGAPDATTIEANAIFQAVAMKIPATLVEVRLFAEDYRPERGPVFSAVHTLRILTPSEHADWLIEQVSKWQRESLEVRDRELQLLSANRQIRNLSEEELQSEQGRMRVEQQAAQELNNGRRLSSLNAQGEELLRLAAKNPEMDPNNLEQWAQMHQVLRDIASNRMPSVSDLLKQTAKSIADKNSASTDEKSTSGNADSGANPNASSAPQVGNVQDSPESQDGETTSTKGSDLPANPSITDQESSQYKASNEPAGENDDSAAPSDKPAAPAPLSLPTTTLAGASAPPKNSKNPSQKDAQDEKSTAPENIEEAIRQQEALLAEFEKVADRLNNVMANLEGSTLIKRLKAASRTQLDIAEQTSAHVAGAFGLSVQRLESEQRQQLLGISQREEQAASDIAVIYDDLKGFNDRKPSPNFEQVLGQMKEEAVYDSLRQLASRIMQHQGLAVAEAEYWSDTLDRWAEDILEDPVDSEGEGAPSGKSKPSFPPALILEIMQVLEQEMNLRERTRVTEQAKAITSQADYVTKIGELSSTQLQLRDRIANTRKELRKIPDGESLFQDEIAMLTQVDLVMYDAFTILKEPHTGPRAIAAETEAIELLLKTQRASAQKSNGGGGTTAGGGGDGTTEAPALALIGAGINALETRDDRSVSQETGASSQGLPEEYRTGLDEYFERIEKARAKP